MLSRELQGDIIQPIWFVNPKQVEERFGPGSFPVYTTGNFRYHWLLNPAKGSSGWLRRIRFTFSTAMRLHKERPIDCVATYSHFLPAICGIIIKWITGAKLIVEIATSPNLLHLTNRPVPNVKDRLKHLFSNACLHLAVLLGDRTHVLAPNTLSAYQRLRNAPKSVFHDFVPIASVPRVDRNDDQIVLLVGAPWYLKGIDLLIEAFTNLQAEFPTAKLQLLGHYPELESMDGSFRQNPQIEILKPRPHQETLEVISQASVLVLASRCEGMGRVLIEAMAAAVPVVGSDAGGIPHIIRDGENGLVFPSGDAKALEQKLRLLLSNPALAAEMGRKGREMARGEFTEERWVEHFTAMVEDAVRGNP